MKNDGGMAEYLIADADNAVLLPDDVPLEQAAPLMCARVGCPAFLSKADFNRQLRGPARKR